jgi:hypothetical protein
MNYWLARGNQKQGPFSLEDVQRMLAAGSITAADLVWTEGMPQWLPVGQVVPAAAPGLTPGPAPGFPPRPPVFGYGQPVAPPRPGGPLPPNLHWAIVFALGMVTGLFTTIWMFVQASFIRKIDPRSNAIGLLIGAIALPVVYAGIWIVAIFSNLAGLPSDSAVFDFAVNDGLLLLLLGIPVLVGMMVCYIMAWFSMRGSLLNYYNSTEPIGLRLSGVMTFFFHTYYFQYHFTRIVEWKTVGVLIPQ